MENGYNILWTTNALEELEQTIEYLQLHFTDKEIKKLVQKIESLIEITSQNPFIFPISESKTIHKLVILEFNTMYYRVNNGSVEILSFFSNRQSPQKRKI